MGSKFNYSYWPINYCKAFSTIFEECISCTVSCVQQMIYTQITPTEKIQTGHHGLPAIFLEISSLLKTILYVRVIFFSFWKGYYFIFQLCRPLFSLEPPNDLTAWVAMGVLCTWWQKTRLLICIVETRIWDSWTLRLNKITNVTHALQIPRTMQKLLIIAKLAPGITVCQPSPLQKSIFTPTHFLHYANTISRSHF